MKAIPTSAIASDGGFGYIATMAFLTPADTPNNPSQSLLLLFENCTQLRPAHAITSAIRTLGLGRYGHMSANDGTGEVLRFSASDNTDPRTNDRVYTYYISSPPVPGDTTPPTVAVVAPASAASVSGPTVTLVANAADNVSVASVNFSIDGQTLPNAGTYSFVWDSTSVANGSHLVRAVARDVAGNVTTSTSIPVTVNNVSACPQTVLNLAAAASDGGFSYLVPGPYGTTPDNSSSPNQSTLRIFENGNALGPAHSLHSDISSLGLGRYSHWTGDYLRFSSSDNSNPLTNGRAYTFCVPSGGAAPPTVSITSPASGATVSGSSAVVTATASSDTIGVQFKLDGNNLGAEDTASPYSATWNSAAVSNGSHTLTAVARNSAGLTATSAFVTIAVSNAGPAKKTLLYGAFNDWWLSDTVSRWANSGFSGFIITSCMAAAVRESHRTHLTKLNTDGIQYGITDNFYNVSLSGINSLDGSLLPAWQDNAGWTAALTDFTNLGSFAQTTGAKGLVFDTERFSGGYELWRVDDPRFGGLSTAQLQTYVHQRGHDVMQALVTAYPGIQIIMVQEGGLWWYGSDLNYQLWPDFYNGMASVQAQPGIIVGSESTYPEEGIYMTALNNDAAAFINSQFAYLRDSMLQPFIENTAYWNQYGSHAIGMWPLGPSYSDKSARYTPAVFKAQLAAAKAVSGPYTWVYGHGVAWSQMTQNEVNTYSANGHYTFDPQNQILPTVGNIQSYFNVVNGTA